MRFAFSSAGELAYLFSADTNGNLTGYNHGFKFGASFPGVSFGRYVDSAGEETFPAQISRTFGWQNSGPASARSSSMKSSIIRRRAATNLSNCSTSPAQMFRCLIRASRRIHGNSPASVTRFRPTSRSAPRKCCCSCRTNPASFQREIQRSDKHADSRPVSRRFETTAAKICSCRCPTRPRRHESAALRHH